MKIRDVALLTLTLTSLAWASAIIAAPLSVSRGDRDVRWYAAGLVYTVGAVVCHQRPERSFHSASVQWPVCARCTGLYLSGAMGLVMWPFVRRTRVAVRRTARSELSPRSRRLRAVALALAAPTLATLLTGAIGLYDPPNAWRAALALPLGALAGAAVSAVLFEDLR